MTLEEFEAEYDFKRPKISGEEKTIVLTCQTGLQASQAAHQLLKSGYVKLAVHQGDTLNFPPSRIDLLCMKNWGTHWTIEISSNE